MSETVHYRWSLEAQRRRQAYLDRIQGNVERFRDRYERQLEDLTSQGLEQYASSEFAVIRQNLRSLNSLAHSDPESARELSFEIGGQISQLPGMARSARREFEGRERQRRKEIAEVRRQATSDLAKFLIELMGNIQDPIVLDFAYDDLRGIQAEYGERVVDADQLQGIKSTIEARVSAILDDSRVKADQWRSDRKAETQREASQALISLCKEQAAEDLKSNPGALGSMMTSLNGLAAALGEGAKLEDVRSQVAEASSALDQAVADEDCRRTVVRSIMESLEKTGFVVSKPKRHSGESDEVVIRARKPSGHEASFRVQADGSMIYKFDHYEGMECKTDIDKVLPLLQDVYGIDLSDERVLWQNPDKISKSARPMDDGRADERHG